MNLAQKLSRARAGRSYAEIARAVGCSAENIRKLEAGISEPGFRLGVAIAGVLGVQPRWLADDSADWPPPPATLENKIVAAVHETLRPFAAIDQFLPEELPVIHRLLGIHWSSRPPIMRAVAGILDTFDDGIDFGRDIERAGLLDDAKPNTAGPTRDDAAEQSAEPADGPSGESTGGLGAGERLRQAVSPLPPQDRSARRAPRRDMAHRLGGPQ